MSPSQPAAGGGFLTIPEVAARTGFSAAWVRELIRRKVLPAIRIGLRRLAVEPGALTVWLRSRETGAKPASASSEVAP